MGLSIYYCKKGTLEWVWLVSSESYHWTRWIADIYPLLDTCSNFNVSSDNFHLTQTLPLWYTPITGKITCHIFCWNKNLFRIKHNTIKPAKKKKRKKKQHTSTPNKGKATSLLYNDLDKDCQHSSYSNRAHTSLQNMALKPLSCKFWGPSQSNHPRPACA